MYLYNKSFLRCSTSSATDNEFFMTGEGILYSDGGTTMQSPADYAEMFEWSDGNSSDEDRRGYTVVLDGNKVVKATDSDDASKIIGGIFQFTHAAISTGACNVPYLKVTSKLNKKLI